MSRSLRELYESSPFSSAQAPYLEAQYERFLSDPAAVAPELRHFFGRLCAETRSAKRRTVVRTLPGREPAATSARVDGEKQSAVSRLIQLYANRGHLIADIDPLGLMQRPMPPVLEPEYVGPTEPELDTEFHTGSRTGGVEKQMPLREILKQLRHIYPSHRHCSRDWYTR